MKILFQGDVLKDVFCLDEAWQADDSFVFLPDRNGSREDWIRKGIEKLPGEMKKSHFGLLTSGSTGAPKLIFGVKSRSEKLARVLHEMQESEPAHSAVLMLPLTYCYSFVNQWVWSRVMNRKLIITPGLKYPGKTAEVLGTVDEAMLCLVGAQVPLFINYFRNQVFPGIIRLHFAGGPFPQQHMDAVQHFFPSAKIFNNYGCAEAMPRLSLRALGESDEGANIGRPIRSVELKSGEDDELLFRSPYRAVAFYDDSGFHEIRDEEWVPTGDLGEPIENGYWRIKGRANEVYKRFGEKIALPQLLRSVYGVWTGQAAFYREADPNGEEGHILVLCPVPDEEAVRKILQQFRKNHPRAHWPLRIESVDHIPLLMNGKVDYLSLKRMDRKKEHWRQFQVS
ncbi:MAG: long-chain fatty acid--CoA ligase [Desulfobacteraceae bacterium]|nr:MAG: long-chain fatty acid--CoA ligase [Desulfobacteraceae bacterium]